MMRPRPARWFESLVAREDCPMLMVALAATGMVELETRSATAMPPYFNELRPLLQQFLELSRRYRQYWPTSGLEPSTVLEAPGKILAGVLARLQAWANEAEPVIQLLQRLASERAELALWRSILEAMANSTIELSQLSVPGQLLKSAVLELPNGIVPPVLPATLLLRGESGQSTFFLIVASPLDFDAISAQAPALKGRVHPVAAWLRDDFEQNHAYIQQRNDGIACEEQAASSQIKALHDTHGLRTLLGDAQRLEWVMENVHALDAGEHFVWITGWTSDFDGTALPAAIEQCSARALLHFPAPPGEMQAPLLFRNPAWARPFELFTRTLGMPAGADADPTPVLAIVVPLMFGYMFGDVGQGLAIASIAWFMRHRYVVARLLFSGGIAAAAFGCLFGDVFSLHGVITPLWLAPLDDPITVLWVPIAGGAALLMLGLALNALTAYWHGEWLRWLARDSGVLLVYFGVLGTLASAAAIWVALAGMLISLVGPAIVSRSASGLIPSVGRLIERMLQLLINTLSFARVGAFALAHAGLSSAIVSLADAPQNFALKVLVLVLGNALLLSMEVVLVSIQTTRLVLFEFFTRFFVGEGRAFRPLPVPPLIFQEKS